MKQILIDEKDQVIETWSFFKLAGLFHPKLDG